MNAAGQGRRVRRDQEDRHGIVERDAVFRRVDCSLPIGNPALLIFARV
jgi:hypothetical protein